MSKIVLRFSTASKVLLCSTSYGYILKDKCILKQSRLFIQSQTVTRSFCSNKGYDVVRMYDEKYDKLLEEYLKDEQNRVNFERLKIEFEYLRTITKAPSTLTSEQWLNLLNIKHRNQRSGYLAFLWTIEKKKEHDIKRKQMKALKYQELLNSGNKIKSLIGDTLFHRIRKNSIALFYNYKLMNAIMYAPKIVFDLSFENQMEPFEQALCTKQLLFAFSENRIHDDPFNIYFCNASKDNKIVQKLHKTLPTLYEPDFPVTITSKSYLDIFDKSKLVYLTPHTHVELKRFDDNDVYIIGGLVDKLPKYQYSVTKAKTEGLRMAKLPLNRYLKWGSGSSQSLPLNQVLSILLDLRMFNNWEKALRHIPTRKLKFARDEQALKRTLLREKQIEDLEREMTQ